MKKLSNCFSVYFLFDNMQLRVYNYCWKYNDSFINASSFQTKAYFKLG